MKAAATTKHIYIRFLRLNPVFISRMYRKAIWLLFYTTTITTKTLMLNLYTSIHSPTAASQQTLLILSHCVFHSLFGLLGMQLNIHKYYCIFPYQVTHVNELHY